MVLLANIPFSTFAMVHAGVELVLQIKLRPSVLTLSLAAMSSGHLTICLYLCAACPTISFDGVLSCIFVTNPN